MSRKLVTIRKIDAITPIEDADKIECAHIGGWTVVVGKGEFKQDDIVLYFEVDSMLPLDDCLPPFKSDFFKFLEPRGKTIREGKAYHRLKTIKLRGQISQGLIMPLPAPLETDDELGEVDYSTQFGVVKYEPPVPAQLNGKVKGWPEWVTHTDEERVQNLDKVALEAVLKDRDNFIATEKIDGTSCTIWAQVDGNTLKWGVCSRNWGFEEEDENLYWKIAKTKCIPSTSPADRPNTLISPLDYVIEMAYSEGRKNGKPENPSCVLQGEIFGENIQGNPLKIKGQRLAIFNLFINGEQVMFEDVSMNYPQLLSVWVPLFPALRLPETIDEMVKQPDGITSRIHNAAPVQIEGLVWRHKTKPFLEGTKTIDLSKVPEEKRELVKSSKKFQDVRASFKCISNKYLLKHDG